MLVGIIKIGFQTVDMSEWEVYLGEYDAPTNLAIDDYLLEKASEEGTKSLRLYEFESPSVILARNECFSDIKDVKEDVDYTRRDTGGSVIYCDDNAVFYSIVVPLEENRYPEELHREYFGPKIADVLDEVGVEKELLGVGEHFSVRIDGKTVSGNSQRKKKDAVLYHGVLALEPWNVERLDSLIQLREKQEKSEYEFVESLPGVFEHAEHSEKGLVEDLLIERFTEGEYIISEFNEEELDLINEIAEEKYGNKEWIRNATNPSTLKKDQGFCFVDWTDEWKEEIKDYGFY